MRDQVKSTSYFNQSRLAAGIGVALLILASYADVSRAQTETIYSPVILYREAYNPERTFQMKEDGGGKQFLPQCPTSGGCGDLSYEGVSGRRFFLRVEASSITGQSNDLVVYTEDYASRTVLVSDKSFHPGASNGAVWSRDNNRIAYYEYWCSATDASGQCVENRSGIVVADLVRDSAGITPVALVNEKRIAEVISPDYLVSQTWAPDNQHLAFSLGRWFSTGTIWHAYFANIPPSTSADPIAITEIVFAGGNSLNSFSLKFSPIAQTDSLSRQLFKLAFQRLTETKPYARYDIFTAEIPADYNGSSALNSTRITNSTNAKNFAASSGVNWSPDGLWLAYVASNSNISGPHDIYKIRSDGGAKAVNLSNFRTSADYRLNGWRR